MGHGISSISSGLNDQKVRALIDKFIGCDSEFRSKLYYKHANYTVQYAVSGLFFLNPVSNFSRRQVKKIYESWC